MMGGLFLILCALAVIGAAACVGMILDACVGVARWRDLRRKLRELGK